MKRLSAVFCACSIVASQIPLAVHASPHPPQEGWAARATVQPDRATQLDEEVLRLDQERRRELAGELRALAVLQVLQPTESPFLWQLLGSDSGADWRELGLFTVRDGEVPPKKSGERVPLRFLVGDLQLADGREITNVVASASSLTGAGLLPPERLLFFIHSVEENAQQATTQKERSTRTGAEIPSLDLGNSMNLVQEEPPVPEVSSVNAGATTCLSNCDASLNVSLKACSSYYDICFAAANAALGICSLTCTSAAGSCLPACISLYAVMTGACILNQHICRDEAFAQHEICYANCPEPACPAFSATAPGGIRSITSALCFDGSGDGRSPIVINLDGRRGFRFTDAPGGVVFDVDADGVAERTAWTAPGYEQAFLVLDRNGNGVIDDGRELFGDVTSQPAAAHPNGYLALAVFDLVSAGGDEDGTIGPSDAVFSLLRMWIDENHDGVSQAGEFSGLADAGVERLDLDYVVSNRRDRYGNLLRYKSSVRMTDRVIESTDVFFVVAEGTP